MKNKNKIKYFIITFAFLFAIVLLSQSISATTSMTSPVVGSNSTSTLTLTVVVDGNGVNNMTNVSCRYNASGGASTTYFVDILNTTASQTTFTSSVSLTSFASKLTYNISCNIYNGTSLNTTRSVSPLAIYTNTTSCSFSVDGQTINNPSPTTITATDTSTKDGSFPLTYSWTLSPPAGSTESAVTSSSTNPTFTSGTDFKVNGEYSLGLSVSDTKGTSSTCSPTTLTVINLGGGAGGSGGGGSATTSTTTTTTSTTESTAPTPAGITLIENIKAFFANIINTIKSWFNR